MRRHLKLSSLALSVALFTSSALGEAQSIKLMSLNIAHARATGVTQLLQSDEDARQNLTHIAAIVRRESPHIVAFQEIDKDSFWNGSFDHGVFIAKQANYPYVYTGSDQKFLKLDYGTALMSRSSLQQSMAISFEPPIARPGKGFVLSTINWPGEDNFPVHVVSLHLDFLTTDKRRQEIERIITTLEPRERPEILMGDFNTEYIELKLIPYLSKTLNLHTWQPNMNLATFPTLKSRLDWVLVSEDFEFLDYRVLSDEVSDHMAIIAEIMLRREPIHL
jgi:endonuclease/exonuclease/phosphatase family metal-dependent hydrolase